VAISKKGVFFTLMAIVIIAFIVISEKTINSASSVSLTQTEAANTRLNVLNTFVGTFEQHATRGLQVAGYIALQNLSIQVQTNKAYYLAINQTLFSCMQATASSPCYQTNQSINHTLGQIAKIAHDELNLDVTYSITNITVSERQPMEVTFNMTLSYNVTDKAYGGWVIQNKTIIAFVDMTGINDPLYEYQIGTGKMNPGGSRQFNLTNYSLSQFNANIFSDLFMKKLYIPAEGKGPSVLQRFGGNLAGKSACCGVESVAMHSTFTPAMNSSANSWVNNTYVDYLLFQTPEFKLNCTPGLRENKTANITVIGIIGQQALRLDIDHVLNTYRIRNSTNATEINKVYAGTDSVAVMTCTP